MSTHNICFYAEIRKIIPELSPYTPTTYVFVENWRKLSQNYHQILLLNNSSAKAVIQEYCSCISSVLFLLTCLELRKNYNQIFLHFSDICNIKFFCYLGIK